MPSTRSPLLSALLCAALSTPSVVAGTVSPRAGTSVLIGNDDGWAEGNIRAFYKAVKGTGWDAVISAPAENKSGSGSSSTKPTILTSEGQYGSIPKGAPPVGQDTKDDHIWYVNAYPVDGVEFGLSNLTDKYFGGKPTIVATGPNVGSNLGVGTLFSGTVGAAIAAANQGIPAFAFSGTNDETRSYTELKDGDYSSVIADASVTFLQAVLDAGPPYLPAGVILNVNYPEAGPDTDCTSASQFTFVQSRVYWNPLADDIEICGQGNKLPDETSVVAREGCVASVSVMKTSNKRDAEKADQATVNKKLSNILTC